MKHAYEIQDYLESTPAVRNLIVNSPLISAGYTPKSPRKSEAGLALKHFWASVEGAHFRYEFEKATGMSLASSQARSLLKSATFGVIIRFRMEAGIDR